MSEFIEQLPEWNNAGIEPPQQKKDDGWQPEEKPPADWFNWLFNKIYKCIQEIRIIFLGHESDPAPHSGHETPSGAQAKANAAESAAVAAANGYTDAAVASVQANLIDHKDQDMPHIFEDAAAQKTYKYGFKQQDNHLVFMYQEVV